MGIKDDMNKLKWKVQRFNRGYSDCDAWSIRDWFLQTMPEILDTMRFNLHGHPGNMTDEEWELILARMSFCFKEAYEDTCSKKNEYDDTFDINFKKNDNGTYDVEVSNKEMEEKWKERQKEIDTYMQDNFNDGIDLFKKYFWDLWD